jgi:hypothetical protein
MKRCALILALALAATPVLAQRERDKGGVPGKNQGMSRDERQRMRDDMRDVYRDRGGDRNRPPQRQLSPQEREQLRRDIQDANRNLKR